jgi:hypothetical protein
MERYRLTSSQRASAVVDHFSNSDIRRKMMAQTFPGSEKRWVQEGGWLRSPERIPVMVSEAQKYRLESIAARHGRSLAGVVRDLIDEKWEEENGGQAPANGSEEG